MLEKMFRRTFMSPQKCGICGKKELFLMLRYVKSKAPKLCKRCYDKEIDGELTAYPVLK
jgi:hypothetical protein